MNRAAALLRIGRIFVALGGMAAGAAGAVRIAGLASMEAPIAASILTALYGAYLMHKGRNTCPRDTLQNPSANT